MKRQLSLIIALVLLMASLTSCSRNTQEMQPGYYTAESSQFDSYGWKAFVTIYVSEDKIVTIEYDAKNASGFLRSWDVNFMQEMYNAKGTYPNQYTREYAGALLNRQDPSRVDAVSGATYSRDSFQLLAEAAIGRARGGDKTIASVNLPDIYE